MHCGIHIHNPHVFQRWNLSSAFAPSYVSLLAPTCSSPRSRGVGISHSNATVTPCSVPTPFVHFLVVQQKLSSSIKSECNDRSGRRKIEMLGYCLSPLVLFVYVGNAEIQWKVFCFKLVCLMCLKLMDCAAGLIQTKISVSTLHSAHITWCHCFLFNGRRAAGRERGREWLNPVGGNLPSTPTQFLD